MCEQVVIARSGTAFATLYVAKAPRPRTGSGSRALRFNPSSQLSLGETTTTPRTVRLGQAAVHTSMSEISAAAGPTFPYGFGRQRPATSHSWIRPKIR